MSCWIVAFELYAEIIEMGKELNHRYARGYFVQIVCRVKKLPTSGFTRGVSESNLPGIPRRV